MNAAIDDLEASATAADADRAALTEEKERQTAAAAVVKANIGDLETKVKAILTSLPEPLVDKIKPLIRRLPNNPENTKLSLGERVQNVVGILSQADKFNSTITLSNESREISEGKLVQVTTLYWGLAQAYFVDNSGSYAGTGKPVQQLGNGPKSMEWDRKSSNSWISMKASEKSNCPNRPHSITPNFTQHQQAIKQSLIALVALTLSLPYMHRNSPPASKLKPTLNSRSITNSLRERIATEKIPLIRDVSTLEDEVRQKDVELKHFAASG